MSSLYAVFATDKPGALAIRTEKLKEHLAHVEASLATIAVAGPLRDEQGNINGSLLVFKAGSAEEARTLLEADPYFKAGIWKEISIGRFNAAAGEWVGGKSW